MDRKYFGPRNPVWVLDANDHRHKMWVDLNRTAASNPDLKRWIRKGFDKGLQAADMAEEWAAYLKENPRKPALLSDGERELQQRRIDHEKWIEEQKAKNKDLGV